jgi:hypothetical protein
MLMTFRYSGYQFAYIFKQFNDADIGVTVGISLTRRPFIRNQSLAKPPKKHNPKDMGGD